jgi:hypothetical protein
VPLDPASTLFSAELLNENPTIIKRIRTAMGQNSKDQPDEIAETEVASLQNADTVSRGVRKTRPGFTLISNDTGTNLRVPGLGKFYVPGGSKLLTRINGTKWEAWSGSGNWMQITGTSLTSDQITNMLVAEGRQFIMNGVDDVWSTANGATAQDEGNGTTSFPKARFGIYHQNMAVVSGVTGFPSYIYASNVLDPRTWDRSVRAIAVADKDGYSVQAIVPLSLTTTPCFLAFKDRAIYYVDTSAGGADLSKWTITAIDSAHGCVGSRAACAISSMRPSGDVAFLSQEGKNFRVRMLNRTLADAVGPGGVISFEIEDQLNGMNANYAQNCIVFYHDELLLVAFPSGSSIYNDTLAVLDMKNADPNSGFWPWSIWKGFNISSIDTYIENGIEYFYFGDASANARVFRGRSGSTDNGAAITFVEEGRREDFGSPELYKSFQILELQFLGTDNIGTVKVEAQIDGNGYQLLGYVTLQAPGPTLPINLPFYLTGQNKIYASFPLEQLGQGRDIQIRVTHGAVQGGVGSVVNYLGYVIAAFLEPLNFEVRK